MRSINASADDNSVHVVLVLDAGPMWGKMVALAGTIVALAVGVTTVTDGEKVKVPTTTTVVVDSMMVELAVEVVPGMVLGVGVAVEVIGGGVEEAVGLASEIAIGVGVMEPKVTEVTVIF